MEGRPWAADDRGVSDFVATILLVALVVAAGGALAVVVTSQLEQTAAAPVSLSLGAVSPGDASLRLAYRNGGTLDPDDLVIHLDRSLGASMEVPQASWVLEDPELWSAGESLRLPLSPVAGSDELLRVIVYSREANSLLADTSIRATAPTTSVSPLGAPSLVGTVTPRNLTADASSVSRLTVNVTHPSGAVAIARVDADLRNLSLASGSANATLALSDAGELGDELGGDGVWSGLLRASANTTPGRYNITVNATDLTGRVVGSTVLEVNITHSLSSLVGNATSALANFTGSFNGTCVGCTVTSGTVVYEGTRINVPTSQNITTLRVINWTWDRLHPQRLDGDALVARVIGGTHAWSVYFKLDYHDQTGTPSIIRLEMWNSNASTVYVPAANGRVPIANLDLNVLDPTTSGFVCSPAPCPATPMTYQNANIQGRAVFIVAWMRDETNNFQPDELGIYAVDAVVG